MMHHKSKFIDVAQAMVTFSKKGGRGFLVHDHLILTAAHCIDCNCDGGMMQAPELLIEDITTHVGEIKVAVFAVEPVSDIAVLGIVDDQLLPEEADVYRKFCKETKPVPLCRSGLDLEVFQEFGVHIFTHKGTWITGSAMITDDDAELICISFDEPIEGGTSGSPIVNDAGDLVAVVSNASMPIKEGHHSDGRAPRPHLALPVWVSRRIYGP